MYLVEPTADNLSLVTSDLSKNLYSVAYVNFLSSIPRPLLEDFASQTVSAGTAESIAQVYDQYLNFIVSEPNLFSLGMGKDVYWSLNSAQTSDEVLDAKVDRIVGGLFSVAVTMGTDVEASGCRGSTDWRYRFHTNHQMSQGRCSRNDCGKAGSKASGSYSQFQR